MDGTIGLLSCIHLHWISGNRKRLTIRSKANKLKIEVENLFRALKHPYFVHGVFLKNDVRVLGLCYVLVIGLLIYALLQRRVRVRIAEEKTPLRLYGKNFYCPTGKTILEQFDYVNVMLPVWWLSR